MHSIRMDYVIIGAGIYGMYAASILGQKGYQIALIEMDGSPLQRASYINQARVHNGYHYPRSVSTAAKSAHYFERFNSEFGFAVHSTFRKIYAIAKYDSLTNANQFKKFCDYVGIPADEVNQTKYFKEGVIEAAFETQEYTYDARKISLWFLEKFRDFPNISLLFNTIISNADYDGQTYQVVLSNELIIQTPKIINATYASINQLHAMFGVEPFKTKYELCEMILTEVDSELANTGITVMDGPFFSIMPFGLTGYHSLSSVSYTPHETSVGTLPSFTCQAYRSDCTEYCLQNCNHCEVRPRSAWASMKQQASNYLNPNLRFKYKKSLFTVKTILNSSEIDDSRPTVIRAAIENPAFISVLSGKFNTIYDLEEVLL